MARQLWLLRHAEAEPHGTRADDERRLTARGKRQSRIAGAALARLGVEFEAALYSRKTRARETAEIAAAKWSAPQRKVLQPCGWLAGEFEAREALDALAGLGADGRLLLVGHEPALSGLVNGLTGGVIDLKKGGLAVVRLESVRGELALLLRPRELALIAGVPLGED
jgi:phosphohistidine phosphatase